MHRALGSDAASDLGNDWVIPSTREQYAADARIDGDEVAERLLAIGEIAHAKVGRDWVALS